MSLFSSKSRTAAEILLTVAVLAFVAYDLVGRSGKPSSEAASLSLEAKSSVLPEATPLSTQSTPAPAATTRFQTQLDPAIAADANRTYAVCNDYIAPTNPLTVGTLARPEAIVFLANPTCNANPRVLSANTSAGILAAVTVTTGSWLSLQNVVVPNLPGLTGLLTLEPGSWLEAVVPATYVPNPYTTANFLLLISSGVCPSFLSVNLTVTNCPVALTTVPTGPYTCALSAVPVQGACQIWLTIVGALSSKASSYVQLTMNKDCSTMTQAVFKQTITGVTGVSVAALYVTYWQCSSVVAVFTVYGATPDLATAALLVIYQSMMTGQLRILLGITAVQLTLLPFPTSFTVTSTYAQPYYPIVPYPILVSSSNPALFALLSLLVIPIAIAITLLVWCAYRRRAPPPPCPCPCPLPMPSCPPPAPMCEPMCTASLCTPSPSPYITPTFYQPMEAASLMAPPMA